MTMGKANLPRNENPLGFGLKSVPKPLQRYWLVRKGNPYFDGEVRKARSELGVPDSGFLDGTSFIEWEVTRWSRHGHEELWTAPVYLIYKGIRIQDHESAIRAFSEGMTWPLEHFAPPRPCCQSDPLYAASTKLAIRYGLDECEFEPGFQGISEDVAGYILASQWPLRRSFRGHESIYETNVLLDPISGKRKREIHLRREIGQSSRAGAGRMLPTWYTWWQMHRDGTTWDDIIEQSGAPDEIEERTVRNGVQQIERLAQPLKK